MGSGAVAVVPRSLMTRLSSEESPLQPSAGAEHPLKAAHEASAQRLFHSFIISTIFLSTLLSARPGRPEGGGSRA